MTKITCPICQNKEAEIRTTKQKAGALRKMKPRAFLHCPDCGSLFSNKVSFSNRINAMLQSAQQQAALSDKTDKQAQKTDNLSDKTEQQQQQPKKGFFDNWGTVI